MLTVKDLKNALAAFEKEFGSKFDDMAIVSEAIDGKGFVANGFTRQLYVIPNYMQKNPALVFSVFQGNVN